jgi:hypothetical protein
MGHTQTKWQLPLLPCKAKIMRRTFVNNHGLVLGFGVPVACSQQKAKLFL